MATLGGVPKYCHGTDPQAHAAPVSRIRVTWDEWLGRGQVGCHLQNPQAMMV